MKHKKSESLFKKALQSIPGGVNSPVRAFKSVGRNPVFIKKGNGVKIIDEDDNCYIDYIGSWGPLILGHNNKKVASSVKKAIKNGSSFGLPTYNEVLLAESIKESFPSMEKVRLTSSGTEAVMGAVRLARAFTGRSKIIKFEGCYHGHSDSMLVKSGSGLLTHNFVDSNGLTKDVIRDTITVKYNDVESIKAVFDVHSDDIAAVIIEPVAANMGLVLPVAGYLEFLREITAKNGSLLIFDEVITGFRVSEGGAQKLFGCKPDLTVLGKIIGGGYPVGAFGGKSAIMDYLSPIGNVYHAGTLSGNPISVAAGLKTLNILKSSPDIYKKLDVKTSYMTENIAMLIKKYSIKAHVVGFHSLYTVFFTENKIKNMDSLSDVDTAIYSKYFNYLLDRKIMTPPSQFEANFLSTAHKMKHLDKTLNVIEDCFKTFKN